MQRRQDRQQLLGFPPNLSSSSLSNLPYGRSLSRPREQSGAAYREMRSRGGCSVLFCRRACRTARSLALHRLQQCCSPRKVGSYRRDGRESENSVNALPHGLYNKYTQRKREYDTVSTRASPNGNLTGQSIPVRSKELRNTRDNIHGSVNS